MWSLLTNAGLIKGPPPIKSSSLALKHPKVFVSNINFQIDYHLHADERGLFRCSHFSPIFYHRPAADLIKLLLLVRTTSHREMQQSPVQLYTWNPEDNNIQLLLLCFDNVYHKFAFLSLTDTYTGTTILSNYMTSMKVLHLSCWQIKKWRHSFLQRQCLDFLHSAFSVWKSDERLTAIQFLQRHRTLATGVKYSCVLVGRIAWPSTQKHWPCFQLLVNRSFTLLSSSDITLRLLLQISWCNF